MSSAKKELHTRLVKLEQKTAPENILVWYSTENPFPIKWSETTPARNFAYAELNDLWNEDKAQAAYAGYDRTKYRDFQAIVLTDSMNPAERISSFRRSLESNQFTEAEYLRELAEANAWSMRHGFQAPTNFLEVKP